MVGAFSFLEFVFVMGEELADTEVGELCFQSLADENVLRFDVAMDNVVLMH